MYCLALALLPSVHVRHQLDDLPKRITREKFTVANELLIHI